MPGRIKKKKEKKKSFALHSYDSERKWRIRGGKERVNRTKKCAKYVREREREETSAGERWNGEENSDLAKNNQPKYQQLFYI